MLSYRYTYIGNQMIVYEYDGGRLCHRYTGIVAGNGIGIVLYPQKGGYGGNNGVPYVKKPINWFMITRIANDEAPPAMPNMAKRPPADRQPADRQAAGEAGQAPPWAWTQLELI